MSNPQDLYEVLGVTKDATSIEIKKAYRKLALAHHPDKVSEELREESEIRFKEISHAYEVLADEDLRANYDAYGTEDGRPSFANGGGFHPGESADFGPEDFFNFFNGSHAQPRQSRPRKTEDAHINVEITLEDLFKGKVIKTTSTRNVICKSCKGSGTKANAKFDTCLLCNGEGQKAKLKRVAPGYVTQEYVTCNNCNGSGKISKKKDRCKRCDGKRLKEETKILEFNIEKGSPSKGKVVLTGESDEEPGMTTGDVILNYTAKKHDFFERKGSDLHFKLNIKLFESLCGFSRPSLIKTLDNRNLSLSIPLGKVLKPGDYIKIPNEGMPVSNQSKSWFRGDQKGDLYIELEIEFPKDNWFLEKNELTILKTILSNVKYPTNIKINGKSNGDDELNSYDIEKFKIVDKDSLPQFEEQPENSEENNDNYSSGYYDGPGVEPECQQQ